MSPPRLTHQNLLVLSAFLDNFGQALAGVDLMKQTGLPSGTLYPILLRFERVGLLQSEWEAGDPTQLRRPRRRFYTITDKGAAVCRDALNQLRANRSFILIPEAQS